MELAAIEIVGKLTKVPYWTCLGTKSPNEILQSKIDKANAVEAEKKEKEAQLAKTKPEETTKEKETHSLHPEDIDDIFE